MISLNGIAIVVGGKKIMPIATKILAITMSIILISFVLETVAATLIAKRKSRYA